MGQSATLYCIDAADFQKIVDEIFYPAPVIGEVPDDENFGGEGFDYDSFEKLLNTLIYYLDPEKIGCLQ